MSIQDRPTHIRELSAQIMDSVLTMQDEAAELRSNLDIAVDALKRVLAANAEMAETNDPVTAFGADEERADKAVIAMGKAVKLAGDALNQLTSPKPS